MSRERYDMEKLFKLFSVDEFKLNKQEGTFTCIISNNTLDRDGEIMLANGCDFKEYLLNPVVFFNHDYSLPVAKAVKLWKSNDNIKAEVKMAERPMGFQGDYFPEYLNSLIEQDVVRGMSVGFTILDTRIPSKKDIKDFGKGVKRVITQWKLLEFSIAPLQSNVGARITSHKGLINEKFNAKIFDIKIDEKKSEEEVVKSEEWDIEIVPQKINRTQEIEIEIIKRKGRIYL